MKISEDKLTKLIKKMINVIKPNGVSDISFRLEPLTIRDDEYYIHLTYIVPDDSEYLRSSNMRRSDLIRREWNEQIKNTIKEYFDTDVIINSTGISSESYYNSIK